MKACPGHPVGQRPRPATVKIGAREYCDEHARILLATPLEPVVVRKRKGRKP